MKLALIIIILLITLYLLTSYIIFIFISRKFNNYPLASKLANINELLKPYKKEIDKGTKWVNNKDKEDIYIKSFDNLKLHGLLIKKSNPKGIFLEVHGYRSTPNRDLYPSCYNYYNMGYSILLIDQRCSGNSEGKYLTFGINESKDIISWIEYINKKYPNIPIILAGISMGASTVCFSVELLNSNMNVKAVLVDSGFISAYNEIKYCLKHYFKIPAFLFIDMINIWCKLIAKYDLKKKNVIDSLNTKSIPLLLVHGEDDDFVPTNNSIDIYNSYKGDIKELVLFPNAQHGMSYLVDSKKYVNSIKDILKRIDNL